MAFRLLLCLIGWLLWLSSRVSPRVRAQITREMTVSIASRDGIARTYLFHARRVSSHDGVAPAPDLYLTVPSAAAGVQILLAPDAVRRIVQGLSSKVFELKGLPAHLLWFYELVVGHLPWRKPRHMSLPGDYVAPDPNGRVASRITREPAQSALDPHLRSAHDQREKLDIWRVAHGAPAPGAFTNYRHVVDVPNDWTPKST